MQQVKSQYDHGLLVLRRIDWIAEMDGGIAANRIPAVPMTHEKIVSTYRGFDGEPWPEHTSIHSPQLQGGLVPISRYDAVEYYYQKVSSYVTCDLIFVQRVNDPEPPLRLPTTLSFLGYDYGFYLSEDEVYSALFHEVIYGLFDELRHWANFLNSHLLLPSVNDVRALDSVRNQLVNGGADLESYAIPAAYAIYGALAR